ncbi:MAG: SigE family RNA polymerase sigma factor [Marmoricola sp.]
MRSSDKASEFVEFTRAHRPDLVRTAVLLCAGDEAFAEDIVQTTLTKLYLAWPKVRRADRPLAYARTSLTNVFVDECRRAHHRREVLAYELPVVADPRAPESDVELRTVVLGALSELGPRQRAVVVLRHWHDLDVYETAKVLNVSVGTVKSQNARALEHLRKVLGPDRDLFEGAHR